MKCILVDRSIGDKFVAGPFAHERDAAKERTRLESTHEACEGNAPMNLCIVPAPQHKPPTDAQAKALEWAEKGPIGWLTPVPAGTRRACCARGWLAKAKDARGVTYYTMTDNGRAALAEARARRAP